MSARRTFYQRQSILGAWRVAAAVVQHARRLSMAIGIRQLRNHCRHVRHMRRCAVRSVGFWATSLVNRIVRAWRLHVDTSILARLEIVPASVSHTSDWFPQIKEIATRMIHEGLAYVDPSTAEEQQDVR